jgi:branched-chain amino acid transport system substrate-binding protein
MRFRSTIGCAAIFVCLAVPPQASAQPAMGELPSAGAKLGFGLVAPKSGFWFQDYGKKPKEALEFAADLINNPHPALVHSRLAGSRASPAFKGAKIEIVVSDTEEYFWRPSVGTAVRQLIDQNHVAAIAGALITLTDETSKIADQAGVPVISVESFGISNPYSDRRGLFLINPSTPDILKSYIKFLTDARNSGRSVRTVGIVYEDYYSFEIDAKDLAEKAERAGFSVVARLKFPHPEPGDVSDQVRELKRVSPDAVILVGNLSNFGGFMEAFHNMAYRPPILMLGEAPSDGSTDLMHSYGKIAQGVLIPSVFDPGRSGSNAYEVSRIFRERTGSDLDEESARYIQAVFLLADAISRADSIRPHDIRNALQQTDLKSDQLLLSYEGIKFNSGGYNVLSSSYLAQLQGTGYVPVWPPDAARGDLVYPYRGGRAR